ncbi:MAG TPA: TetR/AcrR family transcriptional regulator [Candidatus Baltobacteraceae bacterium]|nr:TetR/AcrR family transcriptional regulator [Candidatus Baltobacteraceae bacterium]
MAIGLKVAGEDPRVTRTRSLLREALESLLQEKSFGSISVLDIAERATLNRATFYAHYADKFELLEAVIRGLFREALAEGDPLALADDAGALRTISVNVFRFVEKHTQCKLDTQFEPQFERAVHAELYACLAERYDDAAALVSRTAIIGAAMQWRRNGYKERAERIAEQIVEVLSRGIAS